MNTNGFEVRRDKKLRSLLKFIMTDVPDEEDELTMELEEAKSKAAVLSVGVLADPEMDARVLRRQHIAEGVEQERARQSERIKELQEAGASSDEIVAALLEDE